MNDRCTFCQSDQLEEAVLMGTAVQPVRASAFAKAMSGAEVRVRVCLFCGHMDAFQADPERLQKMMGDEDE